jgi:siroheme synthase-like protein
MARDGLITVEARGYAGPEDLRGSALVIAATDKRDLNRRIALDAAAAGIPHNTADDPAHCSFFFPALVTRGDLVAGITTSGSCPGLAGRLRKELEGMWPEDWWKALEVLAAERQRLMQNPSEQNQKVLELLIENFLHTGA